MEKKVETNNSIWKEPYRYSNINPSKALKICEIQVEEFCCTQHGFKSHDLLTMHEV